MKKIIAIISITLLMTACSSKLMSLKEGASKETTVTFSNIPSLEELVTVDEETTTYEELAGDKYIITAVKGEKTEVLEFPVTFETVDIDGTLPVDLSHFYSDLDKLAKISYVFNDDETVMTITDENVEEPHSFDVPVNVIYPSYTIADNITIDTYTGYDINDFVTADEGVEVTAELDEENSILDITLTKNNWSVNESKEVTLINSNPYPIVYRSVYDYNGYKFDWPYTTYTFVDATHILAHSDYNGVDWTISVGDGVLTDNEYGYTHSYYIEGDCLYDYVNELNCGTQKNVQGSYSLYQRVYE